jgi:tyrosyl-tRNA synthetase
MKPTNLPAYGKVEAVPTLSEDLAFRGLIHQMTDSELPKRLDQPGLTVYAGFDPSADSLHVGNLLQLCTLRRFQEAGHRPISLAGGGTGMIGDPGGKDDERQLLDLRTIEGHLERIRPQLGQFLDLDDDRALLLNNAEWLGTISTLEFLRDVGKHFTVNAMVAKESVKTRFERPDQGISYTEFSYMLLQAYDFLRLHVDHGCDLQIGGSDQWGNITMGVELIRKVCGDEVWGLTTPLIVKPDGTKYGKTETGTVWLNAERTSPFTMYQFFLNTADEQVGELLRYLSFLGHDEIAALDAETAEHPERREAQKALARSVVALVHGEAEVARSEEASEALFGEAIAALSEDMLLAVTEDAPTTAVPKAELLDALTLVDVLERSGLTKSKKEARRTIDQGGVYVNNVRQSEATRTFGPADLLHDRYLVLRKGRREVHIVRAT